MQPIVAVRHNFTISTLLTLLVLLVNAAPVFAQVQAKSPYTVSVFATSVPKVYYQPDSIALWNGKVFVGFGNNAKPDGTSGSSTIVEFSLSGQFIKKYTVKGHNDGLKVNPKTGELWAMQNEDANPNLVILDPNTGKMQKYTFDKPAHGGGYDDIAFNGDNVYLSASNPSNNPNTQQAIVKCELKGSKVVVTPVLLGNANAVDVRTGNQVQLNLQDPDSMRFDAAGDLMLDSQADGELIFVRNVGSANQSVFRLPLTANGQATQIDDTIVASPEGVILVSDRDGETVYAITAPFLGPDQAYSAGPTFVGRLNTQTGAITPVVTGMVSPHGMAFVKMR